MINELKPTFFNDRMNELGIDRLELAKRFVAIRQSEGDAAAKLSTRKNMIYRLLSGESDVDKMQFSTLRALIIALEGDAMVIWQGEGKPKIKRLWNGEGNS